MDQWSRQSVTGSRLPVETSSPLLSRERGGAGSPDLNGASLTSSLSAAESDSAPSTFSRSPIPSLTLPPKRDFEAIRLACLAEDELYQDPEFPASDSSLYYSRQSPHPIVWKRPWVRFSFFSFNVELVFTSRGIDHGLNMHYLF